MLLAFSAAPDEVEVLLISLTFGNVEVRRQVTISLSHHFSDFATQMFCPLTYVRRWNDTIVKVYIILSEWPWQLDRFYIPIYHALAWFLANF
jgi:hypothetical protein